MPKHDHDPWIPESTASLDQEATYEHLSSSIRLDAILSDIYRSRLILTVRLQTQDIQYASRLCRLDPANKSICLGALEGLGQDNPIDPGQTLDISVSLKGASVRFTLQVEEVSSNDAQATYCGPYPKQILYLQRREIFRVQIPLYDRRHVKLHNSTGTSEICSRLLDISVKGFCIEAKETELTEGDIGSKFVYYNMELPGLRIGLSGSATLINVRRSAKSGYVSAGFIIEDRDPLIERALMQAALYYQREAKRIEQRDLPLG